MDFKELKVTSKGHLQEIYYTNEFVEIKNKNVDNLENIENMQNLANIENVNMKNKISKKFLKEKLDECKKIIKHIIFNKIVTKGELKIFLDKNANFKLD